MASITNIDHERRRIASLNDNQLRGRVKRITGREKLRLFIEALVAASKESIAAEAQERLRLI